MVIFFYQICECEELHETISSLKQQLSEALELKILSPVVSNSQIVTETKSSPGELCADNGNAVSKDKTNAVLLHAQVCFSSSLGVLSPLSLKR